MCRCYRSICCSLFIERPLTSIVFVFRFISPKPSVTYFLASFCILSCCNFVLSPAVSSRPVGFNKYFQTLTATLRIEPGLRRSGCSLPLHMPPPCRPDDHVNPVSAELVAARRSRGLMPLDINLQFLSIFLWSRLQPLRPLAYSLNQIPRTHRVIETCVQSPKAFESPEVDRYTADTPFKSGTEGQDVRLVLFSREVNLGWWRSRSAYQWYGSPVLG